MLYRFCVCGAKITYNLKRCDKCEEVYKQRQKDRWNKYRANRPDKEYQQFYASKSWEQVRNKIRVRDNYICMLCWSKGEFAVGSCVHHIEEIKENFDLRLNENNLIMLCDCCHSEVHDRYKSNEENKIEMQNELKEIIKNKND